MQSLMILLYTVCLIILISVRENLFTIIVETFLPKLTDTMYHVHVIFKYL